MAKFDRSRIQLVVGCGFVCVSSQLTVIPGAVVFQFVHGFRFDSESDEGKGCSEGPWGVPGPWGGSWVVPGWFLGGSWVVPG
eukprot:4360786-Alexandrium_andersonii.AAC.1